MVYVPAVGKQTDTGFTLGVVIVMPGIDHLMLSMVPVLVLVNVRQLSWQTLVADTVNDATGAAGPGGTLSDTLSIANEGSVPTPSSSFTHLNAIFTVALLLALVGSKME